MLRREPAVKLFARGDQSGLRSFNIANDSTPQWAMRGLPARSSMLMKFSATIAGQAMTYMLWWEFVYYHAVWHIAQATWILQPSSGIKEDQRVYNTANASRMWPAQSIGSRKNGFYVYLVESWKDDNDQSASTFLQAKRLSCPSWWIVMESQSAPWWARTS